MENQLNDSQIWDQLLSSEDGANALQMLMEEADVEIALGNISK